MPSLLQTVVRWSRINRQTIFLAVPPNAGSYDHRTYYSMVIANLLAMLLHLVWIFVFFGMGLNTLSLVNVGSVLIWILNIAILCKWGAVLTAVVIGSAEVVGHQFLAIYYLGWGYGFQYFLLVIVAFAFMMNFRSLLIPGTMFVISLLSFLGFYYFVQYWNLPHADPGPTAREGFLVANVTSAFTIIASISYVYSEAARTAEAKLEIERQKSEKLLLNILPVSIARQLKEGDAVIAEHFDTATVLFCDIVGFTSLSEKVTPAELVNRLNRIFSAFDELAEKHGLEKIKTIGDAYMVAGGFPQRRDGHVHDVAAMALDMLEAIARCNEELRQSVSVRIGIHTGPAVAGVIGTKKFAYDVWGDTVNTASRLEASGMSDRIQISEQTAVLLGDGYVLEARGAVELKGKGKMNTFWLLARHG